MTWELRLSYRQWSAAVDRGDDLAAARAWLVESQGIVAGQIYRIAGPDRSLKRHEWRSLYRQFRQPHSGWLTPFITRREVLYFGVARY